MMSLDSLLSNGSVDLSTSKLVASRPKMKTGQNGLLTSGPFLLPATDKAASGPISPLDRLLASLSKIKTSLTAPTAIGTGHAPELSSTTALSMQDAIHELARLDQNTGIGALEMLLRSIEPSAYPEEPTGLDGPTAPHLDLTALTPEDLIAAIDSLMTKLQNLVPEARLAAETSQATPPRTQSAPMFAAVSAAKTNLSSDQPQAAPRQRSEVSFTPQSKAPLEAPHVLPEGVVADALKPANSPNDIAKVLIFEAQRLAAAHRFSEGLRVTQKRPLESVKTATDFDSLTDIAPRPDVREHQSIEKPSSIEPIPQKTPARLASQLVGQIQTANLGEGRTRVDLTPRGLGAVSIDLSTQTDGAVSVVVRVENPTVLSALRDARDMLEIVLGVSDGGSLDFQDFGQQRDRQSDYQVAATGAQLLAETEDDAGTSATDTRQGDLTGSGRLNLVT